MKKFLLISVFALAGLGSERSLAQSYDVLTESLVDKVVVPAYERYAAAIAELPGQIEGYCANPDPALLEAAQGGWRDAMLAWQHAQPIQFGPVEDEGITPQIAFWPDKHGTAGRQFNKAMASQDPSLTDPEVLPDKSVGLTSLVNLERLLFGKAMLEEESRDYACAYGIAVARHQAKLADILLASWTGPDGFRATVVTAGPGNDVYFSAYDPTVALYRSIANSVDGAIQLKLEPPLGKSLEKARGRRAENWRSQLALPSLVANIETARDLYVTPGGFSDLHAALGADAAVDKQVRAEFDNALAAAQNIPLPLAEAVQDEAARPQVVELVERLKALRAQLRGPVASGLGLSIGFNATDGD